MNRPEFRVWDKVNNKFWVPTYEAYKGKLEDLSISLAGELIMRTLDRPVIHESLFKDRFIINQYAGLIDENGKKLYEGDCILVFDEIVVIKDIFKVGYMIHECTLMDGNFKIIGNIYENKLS